MPELTTGRRASTRRARLLHALPMALSLAGWLAAAPLAAQPSDTGKVSTQPLFTLRDAIVAGGFAVATLALGPVDRRIALSLQDSTRQANRFMHHAATGLELFTVPGAYIIGGSLYVVGRLGRWRRVADLGLHGTEAVLLANVTTELLKGLAGRARPFVTGDTNVLDFRLGRGFQKHGDYSSFPSGHSSAAFAAASAVTSETSKWWPRATWIIAPVMYGGATLVGLSRMYHNKHWASDVVGGAAVGTFSGLKVVRYSHSHPDNRLDRWLLHTSIAATPGGGAAIVWSTTMR